MIHFYSARSFLELCVFTPGTFSFTFHSVRQESILFRNVNAYSKPCPIIDISCPIAKYSMEYDFTI